MRFGEKRKARQMEGAAAAGATSQEKQLDGALRGRGKLRWCKKLRPVYLQKDTQGQAEKLSLGGSMGSDKPKAEVSLVLAWKGESRETRSKTTPVAVMQV